MRLRFRTYNGSIIKVLIIACCLAQPAETLCQAKQYNPLLKWSSWVLLQAVPSITYFEDRNQNSSSVKFGLEWQVIPFSYAFNTNKYVSKTSFFYVNPTKRFAGSVEAFFEPDYITGNFKYSNLKKFMFKTKIIY